MRIREKLKNIIKLKEKTLDYHIAEFIKKNAENKIFYKSKEIAFKLNISKSTLTLFSKKLGYEGYGEMIHSLMAELEFYGINKNENKNLINDVEEIIKINSLFDINLLNEKLNFFKKEILISKKVLIVCSSEDDYKQIGLFANYLNMHIKTFYFQQRKIESTFIKKLKENDLTFFILTGLEIEEILLNIDYAFENKLRSLFIVTDSHFEKIKYKNNDTSNILLIKSLSQYNSEVRSFLRIGQINFILTNLILKITKHIYK
ncbi:MurR/RpiR family transcriptional regulator [Spiroplasma gladiatoris]|uniref:MurR/RpiR family transcriptional regulator n=1 Tax=Spiroplasma gladiatoris TaxID=2143 RepID=A0A4P7AJB6_9MOLU|nr:hypothetical protein [Spiroplasma gladiatoris]QBQ07833.1 MurR/RpiR family transcriptional regulator [Spiroplasma gladiatoris]